jgi:hypothetical protein
VRHASFAYTHYQSGVNHKHTGYEGVIVVKESRPNSMRPFRVKYFHKLQN